MKSMLLVGRWLSALAIITLTLSCESSPPIAMPTPATTQDRVEASPSGTAIAQTPVSPLAPGPTRPASPLAQPPAGQEDWAVYRGWNPYRPEVPPYEVRYDPRAWSLVEETNSSPYLLNPQIPNCRLRLLQGPIGAKTFTTTHLAGRVWRIAFVAGSNLLYSAWTQDLNSTFHFGILLPEESASAERTQCQTAAEAVIDTFTVVEE